MKSIKTGCCIIGFLMVFLTGAAFSAEPVPHVPSVVPEFSLATPDDPAHKKYLGIESRSSFSLKDLKSFVVIIEIYSMYCPYCQKEAPELIRFYNRLQSSELKHRVKLIGIGAGNTDYEVKMFQEMYKIPFPLFSDSDFAIHKKVGNVRTPHFICTTVNSDGSNQVFYSRTGSIKDYDAFFKLIKAHAGK